MRQNKSRSSSQTARATLALREMLINGRFRPGERIREVPLAAQLRVSRIPLRLALELRCREVNVPKTRTNQGTGGGTYNPIAGRITTLASPMRQIQFALKLIF